MTILQNVARGVIDSDCFEELTVLARVICSTVDRIPLSWIP